MTRSAWLARLVHVMEEFAPTALADRSWDNVGLLLECPRVWAVEAGVVPEMPHRVLLTIDITEAVFEEAVRREAQLILAYHPPWFRGEKSLTLDRSAGMMRMVALCASQGISIYSPHSALDAIQNGINDHVLRVLLGANVASKLPIVPSAAPFGMRRCNGSYGGGEGCGIGRVVRLREPARIGDLVARWGEYAKIPFLRIALADGKSLESTVASIAVCVGAGASVLRGVDAELFFTGEMSHHDVIRSNIAGASVILTEHSNCERGYLADVLQPALQSRLPLPDLPFDIVVSEADRDPITIIPVAQLAGDTE